VRLTLKLIRSRTGVQSCSPLNNLNKKITECSMRLSSRDCRPTSPSRGPCDEGKNCILRETALHSLQKRRMNIVYRRPYKGSILEPGSHIGDVRKLQGLDIREFLANAQNKTQDPKGSPRSAPNVLDEG
jgi:hypothetical protein